jgi:hypothetical protein
VTQTDGKIQDSRQRQNANLAYERLSVTQELREQASFALDLAQARYNLG